MQTSSITSSSLQLTAQRMEIEVFSDDLDGEDSQPTNYCVQSIISLVRQSNSCTFTNTFDIVVSLVQKKNLHIGFHISFHLGSTYSFAKNSSYVLTYAVEFFISSFGLEITLQFLLRYQSDQDRRDTLDK